MAILGVCVWRSWEPSHDGRQLSEWLKELYWFSGSSGIANPAPDSAAARALRQIGPKAVPILERMFFVRDSPLKKKVAKFVNQQSFVTIQLVPDWVRHMQVFHALQILGPQAELIVPTLINALSDQDDETRARAAFCLQGIGGATTPDAKPQLLRALRSDPADNVRMCAAMALGRINPVDHAPCLVHLVDPQFVAAWADVRHRPRMR